MINGMTEDRLTTKSIEAFDAACAHPDFRYSRARSWRADGSVQDDSDYVVYAYHICHKFGGVTMAAQLFDFDAANLILLFNKRTSPLSPTEGHLNRGYENWGA